ncbi:MAG: response regulator transcription factor [Acidimicrobiia bacterium]|nr:response regulator transcription factor [Acidimicrobiia bacterium]
MSDKPVILVVDDEESYRDALSIALDREGFSVITAADGAEALTAFDRDHPVLVLLDVMLPKMSGIDICREIRSRSSVPIIMVTAKNAEIDTVVGLEVGADDYITKPFSLRELVARVRALLRRAPIDSVRPTNVDLIEVGAIRLDAARHEVFVNDELTPLTRKEFELLEFFLLNADRVLTRDQLIDRVWGSDYYGDTKTLDVHVKRLRAKIEAEPANPERLITVRGVGYRYEKS